MLSRAHISTIVVLAALVWGGALLVLGLPVSWQYLAPFTVTVSVLTGLCVAFERWCWRWPIFRGWLVKQPNIQGTWRAALLTAGPGAQTRVDGVMVIRQTYSAVSARLFTKESSSHLVAQNWVPQADGLHQLTAVYQNTPDVSLRGQRSEIHYGAFLLDVRGDPPERIVGHYWTDRASRGSIELAGRTDDLATGFVET